MKTSATNRKLRLLITGVRNKTLLPRPEFQRRLVWSNQHKLAFIETVLLGYPFPEIYIASGNVDPESGEGTEMLVDGQQRVTTLYQYFVASPDLKLTQKIPSYSSLSENEKIAFLEYEVVVRDLGTKSISEIREIFQRINSTNYALNAMEIHNARYEGELKAFAEDLAKESFFENNGVFLPNEVRRMNDVRFVLTFIVTIMSNYFHRDIELENYLEKYNDEFEVKDSINAEIQQVFKLISQCNFDLKSRVWKKADLLTLLVELYRLMFKDNLIINPSELCDKLHAFYERVDRVYSGMENNPLLVSYHTATSQASNDRASRIVRGKILREFLIGEEKSLF